MNILLVVLSVPVAPCRVHVLGRLLLKGNGIPSDMRVCEQPDTTVVSKGLFTRLLGSDGYHLGKDILRVLLLLLLPCGRSCAIVGRLPRPRGCGVIVGLIDTICLIIEVLLEQALAILFVLELPDHARVIFPRHQVPLGRL